MGGYLAGLASSDGPLVDVVGVYKRAFASSLVMAVVGAIAAAALGHWLIGPGALVGVLAGAASNRAFQKKALRSVQSAGPTGKARKRPIASSVLARLGLITAVVLYFIYALPQLGWGMIAGVGLFQMALVSTSLASLARAARQESLL